MGKLKVSKAASQSRARKTNSAIAPSTNHLASEDLLAQMSLLPVEVTPLLSPAAKGNGGNGHAALNGPAHNGVRQTPNRGPASVQIAHKIKELVRLAQEQGYLTYSDISGAWAESPVTPEQLDGIY